MEPTYNIYNIKSRYILQKIFNNLKLKQELKLIKYNKYIQNKIGIKKDDYKNYSKIIIEIIPSKYKNLNWGDELEVNTFVNIDEGHESYFHIYFNDNNNEANRNYIKEEDKIYKIKIILDREVNSLAGLFKKCSVKKIDFKQLYREDITDMSYMFCDCISLKEIKFNMFNTNNVTDMSFMFSGCESLTSINLSLFNTKKVTKMIRMFSRCKSLKSIDISNLDINNETNKTYMFVSDFRINSIKIKKNFLQDVEALINNPNYIKKYYYLINSFNYKCELTDDRSCKFNKKELDDCLFENGFQIINFNIDTIIGVLEGPINSNYENGLFFFKMIWNNYNYPFEAPKFYFITKIFHPNVGEDGLVSYIDDTYWTPALRNRTVILSIQSLLESPSLDVFMNQEAAKLYKENKNIYDDTVKDYVNKYANYSIYKNKLKEYEIEDLFKIVEN